MYLSDQEIYEADLFDIVGLQGATLDQRVELGQKLVTMFGVAAFLEYGSQLSDKDNTTFMRLNEEGDGERLQAFLASRGIDAEAIVYQNVVRIKRSLMDAGKSFRDVVSLERAIRAHLPLELIGISMKQAEDAQARMDAYIDSTPYTDKQKSEIHERSEEFIEGGITARMDAILESQLADSVAALFKDDKIDEAVALMWQNGVDFGEIVQLETQAVLERLQNSCRKV